ncbi:MAG: EAL domain-containing protein [Lachnospiraceae bacterium]|nr:EAL domain-containing protein [Lachnospiraceae bacterium]
MIYFDDLPLSKDILDALSELKINYVFQSIFYPDGKTVFAREALMRPQDMDVTELIEKYQKEEKLHILEVATLFGATQAYFMRGYKEILSVNTFPNQIFTRDEVQAYIDYFGDDKTAMMLETLEYPELSVEIARTKREFADINDNLIAIDDFGTGISNFDAIEAAKPDIVKIDRTLLKDIDLDRIRQTQLKEMIDTFHERGMRVVAEGIETEAEFDTMKILGADLFQGYYLGMPE